MTLGQRIQQLRLAHSLTQEQLGERLGTTRQTVSKWELDQTLPELERIVQMSRLFSVTTDSILVDGISTFETDIQGYTCGIYRSSTAEIVETELFALIFDCSDEKRFLSARLYHGIGNQKKLCAICWRDQTAGTTGYAYLADGTSYSNEAGRELTDRLGESYDVTQKNTMRRMERFFVDHSGDDLPKVGQAGIADCLKAWRLSDSFRANVGEMFFVLCTNQTEYVFSIQREGDNVYCGASYNIVFELGLFSSRQYFRIRSYRDNSQPWCSSYCNFSCLPKKINIPTQECQLGQCVLTSEGHMFCVKRYSGDEIVLQGCSDDEYIYRRTDRRTEIFQSEE